MLDRVAVFKQSATEMGRKPCLEDFDGLRVDNFRWKGISVIHHSVCEQTFSDVRGDPLFEQFIGMPSSSARFECEEIVGLNRRLAMQNLPALKHINSQ